MKHTNRLASESSPYLLQHAHNPVDWYPWCEEALQKAKSEDKPILVSIGYAACHWCHVMEKESFEDETVAAFMNNHFVSIKIDREERPDLDHFFMDALQAISGQGGWPLNMFLTSDGRPFYGGTYFPPQRVHTRISWKEVLEQISKAYTERRNEVEEQADNLIDYLNKSNEALHADKGKPFIENGAVQSREQMKLILENIFRSADTAEGGFGHAPKFPQTFTIQFLLRYGHQFGDERATSQALLSIRKMMRGGIYDQVGGGFCRYSTDANWLAPHFEKMTYDNALLLVVLSEAYQITKDEEMRRVATQTVDFMFREMRSHQGGYYAAIDADSEGEEGKFYTWTKEEFDQALGDLAPSFAPLLDVSDRGNWEGTNILRLKESPEDWASRQGMDPVKAILGFKKSIEILMTERGKRIRPQTDEKVILGWNALFNYGLTKAALAFHNSNWLLEAERNMDFLLGVFYDQARERWLHTHMNGVSRFPAFLDDLSFLVQAMLCLYEPTGNKAYLVKARDVMDYIISHFSDQEQCLFYFTPDFHEEIKVRKKEIYDGALPSSNAIMCWNLYRLGILLGKPEWRQRSLNMLAVMQEMAQKYPTSFGVWNGFMLEQVIGTKEIVVMGKDANISAQRLLFHYLPHTLVMSSENQSDEYPLLKGRSSEVGKVTYFLCRDFSCLSPVYRESDILDLLLTK